jgi:hypothetical protein
MDYREKIEVIAALLLVGIAVLGRTVFHIAPNVEFVTAASLLAGVFLRPRYAIAVPLGTMLVSDLIIGNTLIFVFTWSAFAVAALVGRALRRFNENDFKLTLAATGSGVAFTLFFFLWTNFGVWLLGFDTAVRLYPLTLEGLWLAYVMGLPFLKLQLAGNLVIVPSMFAAAGLARHYVPIVAAAWFPGLAEQPVAARQGE